LTANGVHNVAPQLVIKTPVCIHETMQLTNDLSFVDVDSAEVPSTTHGKKTGK
jgi:hypothetical protein